MKRIPLLVDADETLTLGQAVATVLEENRERLGISADLEALLRASIAGSTYAVNAYTAMLAGARKSPAALSYLNAAKLQCDQNIRQLRRRLTRCIGQMCRYMSNEDLLRAADYVVALRA